jgi:hypothetical protein
MASAPPRLYIAIYTDEDVYGEVAEQIRANVTMRFPFLKHRQWDWKTTNN